MSRLADVCFMKSYHAVQIDNIQNIIGNYNDYAFFNSGEYRKIVGHRQNQSKNDDVSGYVKLTAGDRSIYLKFHSSNTNADEVKLSYANLCRLGIAKKSLIEDERGVSVYKSNWFKYYWYHGDSGIKMPFRWAFVGYVFLMVEVIQKLYKLIQNIF